MKKEFIEFINKLMEANPELTKQIMTDDIEAYLNVLKEIKAQIQEEKNKISPRTSRHKTLEIKRFSWSNG